MSALAGFLRGVAKSSESWPQQFAEQKRLAVQQKTQQNLEDHRAEQINLKRAEHEIERDKADRETRAYLKAEALAEFNRTLNHGTDADITNAHKRAIEAGAFPGITHYSPSQDDKADLNTAGRTVVNALRNEQPVPGNIINSIPTPEEVTKNRIEDENYQSLRGTGYPMLDSILRESKRNRELTLLQHQAAMATAGGTIAEKDHDQNLRIAELEKKKTEAEIQDLERGLLLHGSWTIDYDNGYMWRQYRDPNNIDPKSGEPQWSIETTQLFDDVAGDGVPGESRRISRKKAAAMAKAMDKYGHETKISPERVWQSVLASYKTLAIADGVPVTQLEPGDVLKELNLQVLEQNRMDIADHVTANWNNKLMAYKMAQNQVVNVLNTVKGLSEEQIELLSVFTGGVYRWSEGKAGSVGVPPPLQVLNTQLNGVMETFARAQTGAAINAGEERRFVTLTGSLAMNKVALENRLVELLRFGDDARKGVYQHALEAKAAGEPARKTLEAIPVRLFKFDGRLKQNSPILNLLSKEKQTQLMNQAVLEFENQQE